MQKTAYEMRISDWSSDVCSSNLPPRLSPPSFSCRSHPRPLPLNRSTALLRLRLRRATSSDSGWETCASRHCPTVPFRKISTSCCWGSRPGKSTIRSEEHTSELQSLMRKSYAVFCLKKKTKLKQQYQ